MYKSNYDDEHIGDIIPCENCGAAIESPYSLCSKCYNKMINQYDNRLDIMLDKLDKILQI